MRVIVWGAKGHMGQIVSQTLAKRGHEVVGRVDRDLRELAPADVIIDFSSPASLDDLLTYALAEKLPVVIATTGHSKEQLDAIGRASESIPVLHASNMSVGMNLLFILVEQAAKALLGSDIEIVETHHRRKVDAPSGSAKSLADAAERGVGQRPRVYGREGVAPRQLGEIGVHAVRGGFIVGQHDVHFFSDHETVTLAHAAHDRSLFAEGAVRAAEFISSAAPGRYGMREVLELG